jgi:hypothetical protein
LDPEKQDLHLARPCVSKPSFGRSEQRTICLKNLSDKVIHRDIIDLIRGGALLDIYIRSNDRSASVSFVEGSAAQAFMSYIKRKDLYIHGKRVCITLTALGITANSICRSSSPGMIGSSSFPLMSQGR